MQYPDRVVAAAAWALENGHRTLSALTGGRWPKRLLGMETLELHTIGRRSGERRSTLLTSPMASDDRVVLVASKGGHSRHPAWYLNLVANPGIELTRSGVTSPWVARTASPEEKASMWPDIVKVYVGYASYQANTERDIPVVICEPASLAS